MMNIIHKSEMVYRAFKRPKGVNICEPSAEHAILIWQSQYEDTWWRDNVGRDGFYMVLPSQQYSLDYTERIRVIVVEGIR